MAANHYSTDSFIPDNLGWQGRALLVEPCWQLWLLLSALPGTAQFRVEVTGVGLRQSPIAIVSVQSGEGSAPQQISAIILADLGAQRSVPVALPRRRRTAG